MKKITSAIVAGLIMFAPAATSAETASASGASIVAQVGRLARTTTAQEQAVRKAKSYLRYTAFSRKGLIAQLEFEGFTASQANYGVRSVGL